MRTPRDIALSLTSLLWERDLTGHEVTSVCAWTKGKKVAVFSDSLSPKLMLYAKARLEDAMVEAIRVDRLEREKEEPCTRRKNSTARRTRS